MAAQGACLPADTRLTGTLGTTAMAAGAAARGRTAQDPGKPQLSCQGRHSPGQLLESFTLSVGPLTTSLAHLLSRMRASDRLQHICCLVLETSLSAR